MTPARRKRKKVNRGARFRHIMLTRGPVWLSRGRLTRVRPGKDFILNQRLIELPQLADELCGLRIAHLSDLHVGELVTLKHVPHIIEATNAMEADLIAVTGDFVDFSNRCLPELIEQLQRLEAPLGVYFVLGNHDYLDDGHEVARLMREADLGLLMNESVAMDWHERAVTVAGIDWAESDEALAQLVNRTCQEMPESDLRILLAHHPHAFDPACRCGFDVVLAGHTHGGQILLSQRRGPGGSLGLGSLAFRYPRGMYQRGPHRMHVSSGVGSWFPLRIRCPAEITILELQAEY